MITIMEEVFITTLIILLLVVRSHAVEVSKACYGTQGPQNRCTKHTLNCSGGNIAIQDAFYSNNSLCGSGLSDCETFVGDITYTNLRAELNGTKTEELIRRCSLTKHCEFDAGRNGSIFNFSVVKYICIKETKELCNDETIARDNIHDFVSFIWNKTRISNQGYTCSCNISTSHHAAVVYVLDVRPIQFCNKLSITTDKETYPNCTMPISYQLLANSTEPIILKPGNGLRMIWITIMGSVNESCAKQMSTNGQSSITILPTPYVHGDAFGRQGIVGAIAGSVTAVLIVCIGVVVLFIWFKFVRNKTRGQKPEKGNDNYALAGPVSSTSVQRGGGRHQMSSNNYDYATIHDGGNPTGQVRANDYDLPIAGKPSSQNGGAALTDDDYNHISHNPPRDDTSPGYDTAAATVAAVKTLKSHEVGYNDYNHLGENKPSVFSSDYDTTVSSSKAVGKLNDEDNYDHFNRSEVKAIDSPYDTANHSSDVSADTTPNPYEFAK